MLFIDFMQEFSDGMNLQLLLNVQWKLHKEDSSDKKILLQANSPKRLFLMFKQTSNLLKRTLTLSEHNFAPILTPDQLYAVRNGTIIPEAINS